MRKLACIYKVIMAYYRGIKTSECGAEVTVHENGEENSWEPA